MQTELSKTAQAQQDSAERARKKKGRVRTMMTLPPAIMERLKEQARAESEAGGGLIHEGGKGRVSVSDLIERCVKEWLDRDAGHNDQTETSNSLVT